MSVSRPILPAAITLVLSAGACGGNSVAPGGGLTEQEAIEFFEAFWDYRQQVRFAGIPGLRERFATTCPLGGLTEFIRTMEQEAVGDTTLTHAVLQITPNSCRLDAGGVHYVLFGRPAVVEETRIETVRSSGAFQLDGLVFGVLEWVSGRSSGDCQLDLVTGLESDFSDPENPMVVGEFNGELCGYLVSIAVAEPL